MITATQAPEKYLEIFDQFNNRFASQPRWLRSLRQEAFARFSETGFPTTHDEDWRFTNVAAVASTPFELASPDTVSREQLEPFSASQFACCLVFVNGIFSGELSTLAPLPKGVTVGSLAAQLKNDPASLELHLGRYLNIQRDPFAALNTAFIEDGVYVN
ncbi:MAG TPA: Fe-S cluster assembly protein SufD, partial [Candidatus Angelobacter sp.]|nr:Fe-S cluster assembly protein SufD [Candidatus Angelobacter sp.]